MAPLEEITRFICLFHGADRARAAVHALEELGFGRNALRTIGGTGDTTASASAESLTELGVPERDLSHLRDGLAKGGVLVSLEAPEDRSDEIERVFHKYSADKIDETELRTGEPVGALAAAPLASQGTGEVRGEAVIPVAQEELVVGKREVDRGGVRVYRHTVAEPVSESINLHEERVALEYREVNRPATDADLRAGTQEIELVETAEVPVVQKVARVVEEVHVGKVESDRTEVVQDTVRHTEVEVEPVDTSLDRTGTRRI